MNLRISRRLVWGCGMALLTLLPLSNAIAKSDSVLYSFCSQQNCTDGAYPEADLMKDGAGNLYGTTDEGGANNTGNSSCFNPTGCGTVFKLALDGTETVLYSFCGLANCADGYGSAARLIMDKNGNLYGTAGRGGANGNYGTVFELAPDGSYTVLYSFCSLANCSDGIYPVAGVVMDKSGNLYGTTQAGGGSANCSAGCGTVFELSPQKGGGWRETVLYPFTHGSDGGSPSSGVIMDKAGNLYGTTFDGTYNEGNVYELAPDGNSQWTEAVLYSFTGGSDGGNPESGVIMDKAGNLFGTTSGGGSDKFCSFGCGVVYKVVPDGNDKWMESVLYTFVNYKVGMKPYSGLLMDKAGNLYGATFLGGPDGNGSIFKLAPDGSIAWHYDFSGEPDGKYPETSLLKDQEGNLYGMSQQGGTNNAGSVYKVKK